MKKVILLILINICFGCHDESNLGNNYFYLNSFESLDVGFPYGSIIYKSSNKDAFEKIVILSDVKTCGVDRNYILVQQIPNLKIIRNQLINDIQFWNDQYITSQEDLIVELPHKEMSTRDINKLLNDSYSNIDEVADSILLNDKFFKELFRNKPNYYIINKKDDRIYGPLEFKDFSKVKKEIGIHVEFP